MSDHVEPMASDAREKPGHPEPTKSFQPSERKVRRIGLIAVHGIGEQGRFEFLDALVRNLRQGLLATAGTDVRVSVSLAEAPSSIIGAARPALADGTQPTAEIVILDGRGETRIGVHEVWWGDIVDPPTLLQPLKFFAWGLAIWATRLEKRPALEQPAKGTVGEFLAQPEPPEGRGFMAQLKVRARLFLVGYLVVVIGVVLSLVLALARLVSRQNIPDPVVIAIRYMSDIKLYTRPTSPDTVPLDHLGQHARFAIRARIIRAATDAALADYERWWVLAHSLGSVVAFSGLMSPEGLVARYLDESRWRRWAARSGAAFRDAAKVPQDTKVDCPAWLDADACVNLRMLLAKFGGLITYGSPLDKFAMLWPKVIPQARDQSMLAGRPWLNIYDETDPVAGVLDSFDKIGDAKASFVPTNIGYAAHPVPLYSHLRYLSVPRGRPWRAANSLSACLARWWLDQAWLQEDASMPFQPGEGHRWLAPGADGKRPEPWPLPWRLRWAWTWAVWILLAVASPLVTAGVLVWLRGLDLLDRVLPEWLGWPSWLPDNGWHLAAALAGLAVGIVFVAGALGWLFDRGARRADPDTPVIAAPLAVEHAP